MTPGKAAAIYEQALAQHRKGDIEAAGQLYDRILRARPGHAGALQHSALIALNAGEPDKAVGLLSRAAAAAPRNAEVALSLAEALNRAGRYDAAVEAYARAAALDPGRPELESRCGHLLLELGRAEEALGHFDRALEKRPREPAFLNDRGNANSALARWEEAFASYDAALESAPGLAVARSNRGNAALRLGRLDEALRDQLAAVEAEPANPQFRLNLGSVLTGHGCYEDALAQFDRGIALAPDHASLRFSRAIVLLRLGRFEQGWADYEWRKLRRPPMGTAYAERPQWTGEGDLAGRTLLLHWEQGFGDTLQFCRYAKLARGRGARVILQVQAPLKALIGSLDPQIQVIGEAQAPPAFDLQCPLMSLPLAFRTTLETIPAESSYLTPDVELAAAWRARLGAGAGRPRLGVVWRGAPMHDNDRNRSLPIQVLARLLRLDADWVSLQKGETDEEARLIAGCGARSAGASLDSFSDTAAVIANLDGVVTVDTSVAHLAGALGRPAWVLLPFDPDWRWLLDRGDSPWYPSLRLVRQAAAGDWDQVLGILAPALNTH